MVTITGISLSLLFLASGFITGSVTIKIVQDIFDAYEEEGVDSLFVNMSGSYFLPCPSDGILTEINAFGPLSDSNLDFLLNADAEANPDLPASKTNVLAYLYALVYRPNADRSMYSLHYGPKLMTHQLSFNPLLLNVPVSKGDLIGVLIPRECIDLPDSDHSACPSHPNLLVKEGKCNSAFFHPMDHSSMLQENIPADEFKEVFVDLNMEAVIDHASGM